MKIAEFGTLQMVRTNEQHFGKGKVSSVTYNQSKIEALSPLHGNNSGVSGIEKAGESKSFQEYLMEAVNSVNDSQIQASNLAQTFITNPDSIDAHDVTIAMSKARMSLNLAQTVIDRLVTDWNEITTTR